MPNAVSSLPSPDLPIRHASDLDGAPDVAEFSFGELLEKVEENLTFSDFIDVINPLQHIPLVSTIYRLITGDEISLGARLAGGALYGGALGVAAASLIAAFEGVTGDTIEQQVAGLFDDTPETGAPAPLLARAASGEAASGEAASGPDGGPTNADKPAQIAAAIGIPANPGRASTAQQGTATTVASIDDADSESDRNFSASVTTPELNNPEYFARPLAAIMPAAGPTMDAAADQNQADERARIAQSIADAQRAQAGMLLASMGSYRGMAALNAVARKDRDDTDSTRASKDPFLAHPYALPRDASSAMIAKAMERALNRYNQTLQQGYSAMTPAAPRGIPLAVR